MTRKRQIALTLTAIALVLPFAGAQGPQSAFDASRDAEVFLGDEYVGPSDCGLVDIISVDLDASRWQGFVDIDLSDPQPDACEELPLGRVSWVARIDSADGSGESIVLLATQTQTAFSCEGTYFGGGLFGRMSDVTCARDATGLSFLFPTRGETRDPFTGEPIYYKMKQGSYTIVIDATHEYKPALGAETWSVRDSLEPFPYSLQ